jgi:hypothetical protein
VCHCEERSDEAISLLFFYEIATAALRQPRNDVNRCHGDESASGGRRSNLIIERSKATKQFLYKSQSHGNNQLVKKASQNAHLYDIKKQFLDKPNLFDKKLLILVKVSRYRIFG